MGSGVAKQYLPLAGVPVLARTLLVFQEAPCIDAIIVAVPKGDVQEVHREIIDRYGLTKVIQVVPGGSERQASVHNALRQTGPEWGIVLVHDGVRPLVTPSLIGQVTAAAKVHGAVTIGVPVKDTVKEVTVGGWVEKTLDRQRLWLTQTPQGFARSILLAAYELAVAGGIQATDDAGLVEELGIPVRMLPGEEWNIKLTTPADFALAERLLAESAADRQGVTAGQDVPE